MSETKNVFVTILGRPNVGKSSLLNALVGEKIAAVSPKPQTTRTSIRGVLTKEETQYVFIDTPGRHQAKNKLGEHMMRAVDDSLKASEVALLVVDCTKKANEAEVALAKSLSKHTHTALILNKIDLYKNKSELMAKIEEYSALSEFDEVIPTSILLNDGIDLVMEYLNKNAEVGLHYFDDESITDQPEKVLMAEIIREKALLCLDDEIPHGIAVTIDSINERDTRSGEPIMDVEATLYCERESHKKIIIGKNGSMIKKISSDARIDLENFFQIKVNINVWIKVKEGWRNKEALIKNFGLS
ncbi:MAG: GTPase Era [Ruminococcus sp.]|nr:GTPase Era [Ruminococcus sp.]